VCELKSSNNAQNNGIGVFRKVITASSSDRSSSKRRARALRARRKAQNRSEKKRFQYEIRPSQFMSAKRF
jgi:hypothetical protein